MLVPNEDASNQFGNKSIHLEPTRDLTEERQLPLVTSFEYYLIG